MKMFYHYQGFYISILSETVLSVTEYIPHIDYYNPEIETIKYNPELETIKYNPELETIEYNPELETIKYNPELNY